MNIPDLTAAQDAAFVKLRQRHNQLNPNDQRTKAQLVEAYALKAFNDAVIEAESLIDAATLRQKYKAASPAVQAQIDALLG